MLLVVSILISILLCQETRTCSVSTSKNKPEDVNAVAKEIEKKFDYVEHNENYTLYAREKYVKLESMRGNPPLYWDWRDKNVISPIKDQSRCNACWAFGSVASIESHLAINRNEKTILSEQFLIDCVRYGQDDAPKCGHFTLLRTFGVIVSDFGGVLASDDYRPYSASPGKCTYLKPPPMPLPVVGFARVPSNEDKMVAFLYKYGPLSAAINSEAMAKYPLGNAIDEPTEEQCSPHPDKMDHAVLIVGYNVYEDSNRRVPYWIIKNSWGTNWGDHGYYYLVRGRNACGIANDVSFPIVPKK